MRKSSTCVNSYNCFFAQIPSIGLQRSHWHFSEHVTTLFVPSLQITILYTYVYCAWVYSFVSLSESNSSCWHCASHRHQGQHKTIIITGYTADDGSPSRSHSRRRQSLCAAPAPDVCTIYYNDIILWTLWAQVLYIAI